MKAGLVVTGNLQSGEVDLMPEKRGRRMKTNWAKPEFGLNQMYHYSDWTLWQSHAEWTANTGRSSGHTDRREITWGKWREMWKNTGKWGRGKTRPWQADVKTGSWSGSNRTLVPFHKKMSRCSSWEEAAIKLLFEIRCEGNIKSQLGKKLGGKKMEHLLKCQQFPREDERGRGWKRNATCR